MKKVMIALLLAVFAIAPMFATDPTMQVTTTVTDDTKCAFTLAEYTDTSADPQAITGKQAVSSTANSFWASVKTNKNENVKISIYSTKLIHTADSTQTLDLYLEAGSSVGTTTHETGNALVLLTETDGKLMRALSKQFTASYNATAFTAASVGTYDATITMVVETV